MAYTAESLPEVVFKDLLEEKWVDYTETPRPEILIINDSDNPLSRVDLNNGDAIVISGDGEQVKYRGNCTYWDRIYQLNCWVYTNKDRQRLRDHYKNIRAICAINKHNFTGWQFIRPLSYQEAVMEDLNIWRGEFKLQIEKHATIVETAV